MKYRIPSTSALIAFECSARHCNFSRAARELYTSQSAISRHIAQLESILGVLLFTRYKQRVRLTSQGEQYYHAVVSALDILSASTKSIRPAPATKVLTLACTHEISHLYLMPRFERLQKLLGESVVIRTMTFEYGSEMELLDPDIDLIFTYQPAQSDRYITAPVLSESVIPICSPAYLNDNTSILESDLSAWSNLTFFQVDRKNFGWASWDDWFDRVGVKLTPRFVPFYNYIYLLEAAAAGSGLALGWQGLIERYLDSGALVTVYERFEAFDRALYVQLTDRGRQSDVARQGLDFFSK